MERPLSLPDSSSRAEDDAELTCLAQPITLSRPASPQDHLPAALHHPAALTFPTLNLDGSLSDLSVRQAYPPAPPAALSSLGAKLKMKMEHPARDPSQTAIDAQYDMVDDISEISNEDHETASLASTPRDGSFTPDGSIVDLREEEAYREINRLAEDGQAVAENTLLDSYLSEDLDTPRQSLLRDILSHRVPAALAVDPASDRPPTQPTLDIGTYRVLFVSESGVTDDTISDVCLRVASTLLPEGQAMDSSISRFKRLPPTPTGVNPSSSLLVRIGEVELVIDHCIGAELHSTGSDGSTYAVHIQDTDKLHTSVFFFGAKNKKIDLHAPDLVIYYVQEQSYPAWFETVRSSMSDAMPPTMTIVAPRVNLGAFNTNDTNTIYKSDLVLTNEQFFHEDDGELQSTMQKLLQRHSGLPPLSEVVPARFKTKPSQKRWGISNLLGRQPLLFTGINVFTVFALLLAFLVKPYLLLLNDSASTMDVAVRREALWVALTRVTNSTESAAAYNISHLLPFTESLWPASGLVPSNVRYQGAAPNHIVISLPLEARSRRFPTVMSTHVHRKDSRLDFNQTLLIAGVYDIALHPSDAHGKVIVSMDTKDPAINVLAEHNFGHSVLYRKRYEKATLEVSKAINKDVMVARRNVRSLGEKLGLELNAGAAATKNVTSEVVVYIARDLQVLANTAVSVFAKAAAASNETAATIKKELMVIRKDLVKLREDVQKSVLSTADAIKALIPTSKTLKGPLALSKDRVRLIKDLLARPKDDHAPSSNAFSPLSGSIQDKVNPKDKTNKADRVTNIRHTSQGTDRRVGGKRAKPPTVAEEIEAANSPSFTPEKRYKKGLPSIQVLEDIPKSEKKKEQGGKHVAAEGSKKKEKAMPMPKQKKGKGKGKGNK